MKRYVVKTVGLVAEWERSFDCKFIAILYAWSERFRSYVPVRVTDTKTGETHFE